MAPEQSVQLGLDWKNIEEPTVMFSNVFLIQFTDQECVLTFGSARPPVFGGPATPEEIAKVKALPVKPIVTLGMPVSRVVELVQLLQQNLQQHFQKQAQRATDKH